MRRRSSTIHADTVEEYLDLCKEEEQTFSKSPTLHNKMQYLYNSPDSDSPDRLLNRSKNNFSRYAKKPEAGYSDCEYDWEMVEDPCYKSGSSGLSMASTNVSSISSFEPTELVTISSLTKIMVVGA